MNTQPCAIQWGDPRRLGRTVPFAHQPLTSELCRGGLNTTLWRCWGCSSRVCVFLFYRHTSCLSQPFPSCLSPPSLLSHRWSPFPSREARRLAETQPPARPSLALELCLSLSMPQELLYESTPAQTWKMASFCQRPAFSSSGTSLGKLWDLQHGSTQATKNAFRQMPLEGLVLVCKGKQELRSYGPCTSKKLSLPSINICFVVVG